MSGIKDRLILASGSPQRFSLLVAAGFKPEVRVPEVDESILVGESANSLVERLAVKKLDAVINVGECGVAADTVVSINEKILGKPGTPEIALEMLQTLSGVTHQVITGVALSGPKGRRSLIVATQVKWRKLTKEEIVNYIQTGEPLDKAGGYGIQGGGKDFVVSYEGSFDNIVGLPVDEVISCLSELDCDCLT
ncbi:Maf family protein [bacterium]|nr:Maf family protein [Acidimicrobiales bacterium]MDC0223746.1 Maf family protein [bacterium]